MKTLFSKNAQRKLCTVLAGGAALMLASSYASASISTTKHNLGSTNILATGTNSNTFSGTAEICVFCHTPHGADSSAAVPIWNRKLNATSIYGRYSGFNSAFAGTTTFDAKEAPVGSVSIACLSCHDGTQAMNVVVNTPGSGTTTTMAGTWTGYNVANGALGYMLSQGGTVTSGPGEFPRLGTDLSNDHPISMQYGGGGITSSGTAGGLSISPTGTVDADFKQIGTGIGLVNDRTVGSGLRVWYIDTNGTAGQQKDDLTLYSRTEATVAGGNQPFVECATCHDPHSSNTTFLRISNAGSALCLTCHLK